jgi:hypothetical protein
VRARPLPGLATPILRVSGSSPFAAPCQLLSPPGMELLFDQKTRRPGLAADCDCGRSHRAIGVTIGKGVAGAPWGGQVLPPRMRGSPGGRPVRAPLDPLRCPNVLAMVHLGTIRLDSASSNRNSPSFTAARWCSNPPFSCEYPSEWNFTRSRGGLRGDQLLPPEMRGVQVGYRGVHPGG